MQFYNPWLDMHYNPLVSLMAEGYQASQLTVFTAHSEVAREIITEYRKLKRHPALLFHKQTVRSPTSKYRHPICLLR